MSFVRWIKSKFGGKRDGEERREERERQRDRERAAVEAMRARADRQRNYRSWDGNGLPSTEPRRVAKTRRKLRKRARRTNRLRAA